MQKDQNPWQQVQADVIKNGSLPRTKNKLTAQLKYSWEHRNVPPAPVHPLPMPLPSLPPAPQPWPVSVQNANRQLQQIYQTAASYIESESLEAHRLQQYGNAIMSDAYSLLLLMEASSEAGSPLREWVESAANEFTELLALVNDRWAFAQDEYTR